MRPSFTPARNHLVLICYGFTMPSTQDALAFLTPKRVYSSETVYEQVCAHQSMNYRPRVTRKTLC